MKTGLQVKGLGLARCETLLNAFQTGVDIFGWATWLRTETIVNRL